MGKMNKKTEARLKRKRRVGKSIFGTQERPRLSIFKSARHMYAQVVIDETGKSVAAASTLDKAAREHGPFQNKTDAATFVGKLVAERTMGKGFKKVVFDRNGFLYHGRVRALATGAREQGLDF
jgi:large subunit ribosomal protein L18